jgi:hypothetical protein
VWVYLSHFDLVHHPERKTYHICLDCHRTGKDIAISLGKDCTLGLLITHLQTHHEEYTDFLNAKWKLEEHSKDTANQRSISDHFLKLLDTRENFKWKYAKWVMDDAMPLTVGQCTCFKEMQPMKPSLHQITRHKKTSFIPKSWKLLKSFRH